MGGGLSAVLSPSSVPQFLSPRPHRYHRRLPPVSSLLIYFRAGTASSPAETGEEPEGSSDLAHPLILVESWPGRAAARIGAVRVYLEGIQAPILWVGWLVAGSHFCWSAWVYVSLCESEGGEVGELLVFSDTLTVLVPGCPVKDECLSLGLSVPVWGRNGVIVQAASKILGRGLLSIPSAASQFQPSHKGYGLHLFSALGYFPSLPLGNLPSSASISVSSHLKAS